MATQPNSKAVIRNKTLHADIKRYSERRMLAFVIDLSLVYLLCILAGSPSIILLAFVVYSMLFCFARGVTIGRFLCKLSFANRDYLVLKLLKREIVFLFLWWAIILEVIFSDRHFVHDRFSNTLLIVRDRQ
ncbi:MAG: hypothetical protein JJV97_06035 [SAR324 cluster bacterium]|nr:hypothetical protein [SAR324 cluster bacterium]